MYLSCLALRGPALTLSYSFLNGLGIFGFFRLLHSVGLFNKTQELVFLSQRQFAIKYSLRKFYGIVSAVVTFAAVFVTHIIFFCSYVYLPIYNLHVIIRSCVVYMFSFLTSICMLW